jgi:uncharacterized protein YodC (DUF2158 family)
VDIKVGDTVQIRSGGPRMTADKIDDEQNVHCVWFQAKTVHRAIFGAALLLKVSADLVGPIYVR